MRPLTGVFRSCLANVHQRIKTEDKPKKALPVAQLNSGGVWQLLVCFCKLACQNDTYITGNLEGKILVSIDFVKGTV